MMYHEELETERSYARATGVRLAKETIISAIGVWVCKKQVKADFNELLNDINERTNTLIFNELKMTSLLEQAGETENFIREVYGNSNEVEE